MKTSSLSCLLVLSVQLVCSFQVSNTVINEKKSASGLSEQKLQVDMQLPFLENAPQIDGDLAEWKDYAYHDGVWDIYRLRQTDWYRPDRNRLTDHGNEPSPESDLQARYYMAWDHEYLYLGAEVHDNVNDVIDKEHQPKRWYYKDCVCWFIEAPRDTIAESFGEGDNAFCFIADKTKPSYGAWWRHGEPGKKYVEEPISGKALAYEIRMKSTAGGKGSFILESRINMAETFGISDPKWRTPSVGDEYSIEIVHTDPDGGDYGGHFILYGTGDNDASWKKIILTGPVKPLKRESK